MHSYQCKECGVTVTRIHKATSYICDSCNRKKSKNKKRPFEWLYNRMVFQAKKRNIPVDMSLEDFLEFTEINCCRYCNADIVWYPYSHHRRNAVNLDRKDSKLGYTKDNVAVCCFSCNTRKSNWLGAKEFQAVNDFLRLYRTLSPHEQQELEYTVLSWKDKFDAS